MTGCVEYGYFTGKIYTNVSRRAVRTRKPSPEGYGETCTVFVYSPVNMINVMDRLWRMRLLRWLCRSIVRIRLFSYPLFKVTGIFPEGVFLFA